jgi:maltose alpha-D-glucosyltransferase/alpha-amylase
MTYPAWLSSAVGYQVYLQSFADSNGDGIGDLPGLIAKLPYIQELGANLIWLTPCFVSPMRDAGYDVADYLQVDPRYGTNEDLERLFVEAEKHGIRVLLDLVAGHTSDQHPWFQRASEGPANELTDRYIWAESGWRTSDGDLRFNSGYADHGAFAINFFSHQPALNFGFADPSRPYQQAPDDPGPLATREAMRDVMRFWLERGAAGFRVDMAGSLVKADPHKIEIRRLWQDYRSWIEREYPGRVLVAEWSSPELAIDAGFHVDFMLHFGAPGYGHLFFNEFGIRNNHAAWFDRRGSGSFETFWRNWQHHHSRTTSRGLISLPTSNHDFQRPKVGPREDRDLAVMFAFLMTWPCLPFVYYGDEIGMRFVEGLPSKEGGYDRTGARTPMQWAPGPGAGFSAADPAVFYLPLDPAGDRPDVESQRAAEGSLWQRVRRLIGLRRGEAGLAPEAPFELLTRTDPGYPLAYVRGGEWLVILNPADGSRHLSLEIKQRTEPVTVAGVKLVRAEGGLMAEIEGRSYGIFQLR